MSGLTLETAYREGWTDALNELNDRLESAAGKLEEMAEAKRESEGTDYDRLRGKLAGVLLAIDYIRGM